MNINTNREYTDVVTIREINAKSILRKHKRIDSWFLSRYGMNLYRGCTHNCVYCDGRAEGYYVDGDFGTEVAGKVNAIEILRRELDPARRRKPLKKGFMMIGGGVGDSYQPIEKQYRISRKALELIAEYQFPVHILTKSTLVKRDIDVLKAINEKNRAIVSFSFSSVDDDISALFEPGVPPPSERLETIKFFKQEGIACGMYLVPVIPFITDKPRLMEDAVRRARDTGVDFINFSGMTLKDGRQKDYFMQTITEHYPDLTSSYRKIYKSDKWGQASGEYYQSIHQTFSTIIDQYKIPSRMPLRLFSDQIDENDLVVALLDHIDYYLKLSGNRSPYGYASYVISQIKEPLTTMRGSFCQMKGIGQSIERVIHEILDSGSSSLYERLSGD
ncbi:radical SAM protein [bacterium]|nr:radical SAM protein [bacterium]